MGAGESSYQHVATEEQDDWEPFRWCRLCTIVVLFSGVLEPGQMSCPKCRQMDIVEYASRVKGSPLEPLAREFYVFTTQHSALRLHPLSFSSVLQLPSEVVQEYYRALLAQHVTESEMWLTVHLVRQLEKILERSSQLLIKVEPPVGLARAGIYLLWMDAW